MGSCRVWVTDLPLPPLCRWEQDEEGRLLISDSKVRPREADDGEPEGVATGARLAPQAAASGQRVLVDAPHSLPVQLVSDSATYHRG